MTYSAIFTRRRLDDVLIAYVDLVSPCNLPAFRVAEALSPGEAISVEAVTVTRARWQEELPTGTTIRSIDGAALEPVW